MPKLNEKEQMLWDYIMQESDEIVLRSKENVEKDGFAKASRTQEEEDLCLKILVAATVKKMFVVAEKRGELDVLRAYSRLVLIQTEFMKIYVLDELLKSGSRR